MVKGSAHDNPLRIPDLNGDPEYKLSILIVWSEVFPRAKSFDVSPERSSLLAFFS